MKQEIKRREYDGKLAVWQKHNNEWVCVSVLQDASQGYLKDLWDFQKMRDGR